MRPTEIVLAFANCDERLREYIPTGVVRPARRPLEMAYLPVHGDAAVPYINLNHALWCIEQVEESTDTLEKCINTLFLVHGIMLASGIGVSLEWLSEYGLGKKEYVNIPF